jgi:hypothetical protein
MVLKVSGRNKKPKEESFRTHRFSRFLNRCHQNPGDYDATRNNKIQRWYAFQGIEEYMAVNSSRR